jgi:hypothetical protein
MTWRDKGKLVFMWLITILSGVVLNLFYDMNFARMLLTGFFGILFFFAFSFMLVHEFTVEESRKQLHDTLTRMLFGYMGGVLLAVLGYVLPLRVHVFLAISGIFCIVVPPLYGVLLSLFLGIIVSQSTLLTDYELGYIVFLCIMGAMISPILLKKQYRILAFVLMTVLSVTAALLFGYTSDGKITMQAMRNSLVEGVFNGLCVLFILPIVLKKKKQKELSTCVRAMEPDFPLAEFMRSLSEKRFVRCQFVAKVCALCALQVSFDENLCACAGFYYDLCDNDEPDNIEYATNLGKSNLLPIEVVRIMSQFHGEVNPISSREAALVDLVYETVRSLEQLPEEAEAFEKEMAVHTVFNSLSKNGRYDVSGLSMNHYLTLRNFLIKEVEHL